MPDLTELLREAAHGDRDSESRLMEAVYAELHRLAAGCMRPERADHTLQPTALVNEAYLRLIGHPDQAWNNRAHFFVAAAHSMRRILIDHSRRYHAAKRFGGRTRVQLEDHLIAVENQCEELLALDVALDKLAQFDPRQSRIVELRFFAGLSVEDTARTLAISDTTVKREWALARAWLEEQLSP
jgi:RNA polymerase sigma factor (TIGR02999 family)